MTPDASSPDTSSSAVDQLLRGAASRVEGRFEVERGRAILTQKIESGDLQIDASGKVLHASRQTTMARAAAQAASRATARRRWRWGIAAGFTVCLLGGVFALRHRHKPPAPTFVPNRVYVAARGERTSVTLTDGSVVWLNAGSRLVVPADFGQRSRTVTADGHVLFAVTHDPKAPFLVHAANTTIKVLGTTFVVRAYRDDPAVTVAVREGAVAVHAGQSAATADAVLHAGDVVQVHGDDPIQHVNDEDLTSLTSFSVNQLTFHRASLVQVARDIGRWYDVDVRISPRVSHDTQITGSFVNAKLAGVVETIAQSAGIPYRISGRRVTFGPVL